MPLILMATDTPILSVQDLGVGFQMRQGMAQVLHGVGFNLYSEHLQARDAAGQLLVLRGLEEFREHLGGELTITLVTRPGECLEVHEMDGAKVVVALERLQERALVRG